MKPKSLVSISDLTASELRQLCTQAIALKAEWKAGKVHKEVSLQNQTMAMIFDKPSLRTDLSFTTLMTQLGGSAKYLGPEQIGLGKRETVSDTAKVVSSMVDVIIARISSHEQIIELAEQSSVPVINAMTDREHPCQILADLMTIQEHFGDLERKIAYVGDADNNVTNSLALAAEILRMPMSIASPAEYQMSEEIRALVPSVQHFTDPAEAVKDAHVIVTDTWVSMGKEADSADRITLLQPYQVNAALMAQAAPGAIFMHCLPAYRDKEVTAEVIDGPQSVVFQEAENRLHAQKAAVLWLMGQISTANL